MLQWVSVTTVHAPAWLIQLHAAYLKSLGADLCVYFIDRPESYTEAELSDLSQQAKLILCDDAYWNQFGGRPTHVFERQLKNIVVARSQVESHWYLHIDIDEFPYYTGNIGRMLAGTPIEVGDFHFQNVERLIVHGDRQWHEGLLRLPNFDRELQARHYGQRTHFLGGGLASYYHGKSLVRGRRGVVQGVHSALHVDAQHELVRLTVPLHEGFVVHYPCICRHHLAFRMQRNKFLVKNMQKLRHEHALDDFMFGPNARPGNVKSAVEAMHTCSPQQAQAWTEAGLCRAIPQAYLERMDQAAGAADVLSVDFAEQSFASFYKG